MPGQMYFAAFSAVAITLAQDVLEIAAPATKSVVIHSIFLGQYSDAADAQDEMLSLLIIRGNTTTGSGGSTITPAKALTSQSAAASTVKANNTTVATAGSPVTLVADSFNVRAGYQSRPTPEERIILAPSERLVVRITAPADSLTTNGTLIFEEIG